MKDIYTLLAEVPVDEQELAAMEQNGVDHELGKARLKKQLKHTIFGQQKKRRKRAVYIAAAAAVVLVTSGAYVGITNPAYAAELPIVGDIFRFLDNGRTGAYDLYKENASEINITKVDQGIAMTIKEAIFDGQTVYYTYELASERDLGEQPIIGGGPFSIKGYRGGMTGSEGLVKVADGQYVGQANYSIDQKRDSVSCKLDIEQIRLANDEQINGSWSFAFTLKAVEADIQLIGQSAAIDDHVVTIDSLEKTPMSFSINYSQFLPESYRDMGQSMNVTAELIVRDDLGNVYPGESQGGHGNMNTGEMSWRTTFGKLDSEATQLIITPSLYYSAGSGGGVAIDRNGNETPLESWSVEGESHTDYMEEIVVEINK